MPGMQVSDKNPEGRAAGRDGHRCETVFFCAGLEGEIHPPELHPDLHGELHRGGPSVWVPLLSAHKSPQLLFAYRLVESMDVCNSSVCVCVAAVSRCLLVPGADGEVL